MLSPETVCFSCCEEKVLFFLGTELNSRMSSNYQSKEKDNEYDTVCASRFHGKPA